MHTSWHLYSGELLSCNSYEPGICMLLHSGALVVTLRTCYGALQIVVLLLLLLTWATNSRRVISINRFIVNIFGIAVRLILPPNIHADIVILTG